MHTLTADNKIINGLWIALDSKPLSILQLLCIHSYCANGHDFHLWLYDDIVNIPTNTIGGQVTICDANEILPRNQIFLYDDIQHFADWFRWELIRQKGGWYTDMDVVCMRPFNFSDDLVFGYEREGSVNNHVIKFPQNHYIATAIANACAHPNHFASWDTPRIKATKILRWIQYGRNSFQDVGWGEVGGPFGFTRALEHFKMKHIAKLSHYFSPIKYPQFDPVAPNGKDSELANEDLHDKNLLMPLLEKSYGVHFFGSLLKKYAQTQGLSLDDSFPKNSPFEILKRRYLPELK